jgi:hypothetical protein
MKFLRMFMLLFSHLFFFGLQAQEDVSYEKEGVVHDPETDMGSQNCDENEEEEDDEEEEEQQE